MDAKNEKKPQTCTKDRVHEPIHIKKIISVLKKTEHSLLIKSLGSSEKKFLSNFKNQRSHNPWATILTE